MVHPQFSTLVQETWAKLQAAYLAKKHVRLTKERFHDQTQYPLSYLRSLLNRGWNPTDPNNVGVLREAFAKIASQTDSGSLVPEVRVFIQASNSQGGKRRASRHAARPQSELTEVGTTQSVPLRVRRLLDEARELSGQSRHAEADEKCDEGLQLAENGGWLGTVSIDDLAELRRLDFYRRIIYFHQWRRAKAKYPVPHRIAIPEAFQAELNLHAPIDLVPVDELLAFLHIRDWEFSLPINRSAFADAFTRDAHKRFLQAVAGALRIAVAGHDRGEPNQLRRKIWSVTAYLCEEDPPPRAAIDVAWVPGYRSHLRAEMAGELFKAGKVKKIFLSGDSPYYAKDEDTPTPLTEALAMAVYLVDKRPDFGVCWADLIVDSRARCTHESVHFSRSALVEARSQQDHPLSIMIVTSPYHLRRARLMWLKFQRENPDLVAELHRKASGAKENLLPDRWYLDPQGVEAYMTECWKIHGGRATGEF
jgi:hypothetical protein